jgi:hypothetical protein
VRRISPTLRTLLALVALPALVAVLVRMLPRVVAMVVVMTAVVWGVVWLAAPCRRVAMRGGGGGGRGGGAASRSSTGDVDVCCSGASHGWWWAATIMIVMERVVVELGGAGAVDYKRVGPTRRVRVSMAVVPRMLPAGRSTRRGISRRRHGRPVGNWAHVHVLSAYHGGAAEDAWRLGTGIERFVVPMVAVVRMEVVVVMVGTAVHWVQERAKRGGGLAGI